MNTLWKLLKADFLKVKHSIFYGIHLAIPLIGIVLFLSYYSFTKGDAVGKVTGYIEILSIAFPLLISIICSFAVEQEALAGNFKELLGVQYGKCKTLVSKISMLLISGFCATLFAIIGFAVGFRWLLGQKSIPFSFYFEIALIIFLCQIFSYLLHLWLNFSFGKGASIGVGVMESLIAALMITGLGEGIWKWIPCAWSVRLGRYFLVYRLIPDSFLKVQADVRMGSVVCICMTGAMFIGFMIWFSFYEGRKEI